MTRRLAFAAAMIAGIAAAPDAHAQEPAEDDRTHWAQDWLGGTFSVQIENDKIVDTDRHYTNGLRLGWVSDRKEDGPDWMRDALAFLYPFASLRGARIGFSLGHTIFTPGDTETRALVPGDRPYAGWLFAGASLRGEALDRPGFLSDDPVDVLDTIEVTLGLVGPQAFGETVQNNYHVLIGVDEANGWDHQIKNEPALNLMFERRWRPTPLRFAGIEADGIPYAGGSLGNVFTFGGAGLILRVGQRLDLDYGPSHIQPSLSGSEQMERHQGLSWYLFAGAEGRAVLHNIFLDGNTFADSHSVDRRTFVGDVQVGIAVAYERARVSLALVQRSKEFDGQQDTDRFGALNLSWHF